MATMRTWCRYASVKPELTTVHAQVFNDTTLLCRVPVLPFSEGAGLVYVTIDEGDVWVAGPTMLYEPSRSLLAIYPMHALASASTLVWITGEDFTATATVSCRVGLTGLMFAPWLVQRNVVACLLPPLAALQLPSTRALDASIQRVSPNFVDVPVTVVSVDSDTTPPLYFRYDFACQPGSYMSAQQCQPCPPGSMCPLAALNHYQRCAPGSYQDVAGALSCLPCPAGTLCASPGISCYLWLLEQLFVFIDF